MKKTIPLLLIALCGLSGALRADSNLLTNGSFEDGLKDWRVDKPGKPVAEAVVVDEAAEGKTGAEAAVHRQTPEQCLPYGMAFRQTSAADALPVLLPRENAGLRLLLGGRRIQADGHGKRKPAGLERVLL